MDGSNASRASTGLSSFDENPWLFPDGEGPPGLKNYDSNKEFPPVDWRTGGYNEFNKFTQQCTENLRTALDNVGITKYLDGEKINLTFWHLSWRLRPEHKGPIPIILFNYQTYEEANPFGDLHSWGARRTSGELVSHTPRLTEVLASPLLYAIAARGDVHVVPYPAYDPRGGTNKEPATKKMDDYRNTGAFSPDRGVITPEQQRTALELTFRILVRPVLEKYKSRIKLVVPKSALDAFLKGMGHSTIAEFELEFPGLLVAIPPHTCVLYNKLFAASANFNKNCQNAEIEWTIARRAFSGNQAYAQCDLRSMMHDETSPEYQLRKKLQLEACAEGGRKCGIEYHRLRDLGDERTDKEGKKFTSMRNGRVTGGNNRASELKRLRDLGDDRTDDEEKKLARMCKDRIVEWSPGVGYLPILLAPC